LRLSWHEVEQQMYLLIAILAAVTYTIGGTFMKLSAGFSEFVPSLMVYVCFLVGATLQVFLLNQAPMGISYILVLGLEALSALLISLLFFRESYSFVTMVGIFLVVMGTALLRAEAR
jgi:multidrug transporter EmrE-like cation transporter